MEEFREPIDYEALIGEATLNSLHEIFKQTMKRQVDRIDPVRSKYGEIERDEIDLDEKTIYIEEYVRHHKEFSFRKLLEKQNSKMEIIVTFLVILEMMKTGIVSTRQDKIFGDIIITTKNVNVA